MRAIVAKGEGAMLAKIDVARAYRSIPIFIPMTDGC